MCLRDGLRAAETALGSALGPYHVPAAQITLWRASRVGDYSVAFASRTAACIAGLGYRDSSCMNSGELLRRRARGRDGYSAIQTPALERVGRAKWWHP